MPRTRSRSLSKEVESYEQSLVADCLASTCGNIDAAARQLGMKRTTLYERLKKWGWLSPTGRAGHRGALRVPTPEAHDEVPEDEWVDAALAAVEDATAPRKAVEDARRWLEVEERYGHVSSGAAMGLRHILGRAGG